MARKTKPLMQYIGPLYGKIGNRYFNTGKSSKDWDQMENALKRALMHLETNYDIDGNRMDLSDAAKVLKDGISVKKD